MLFCLGFFSDGVRRFGGFGRFSGRFRCLAVGFLLYPDVRFGRDFGCLCFAHRFRVILFFHLYGGGIRSCLFVVH